MGRGEAPGAEATKQTRRSQSTNASPGQLLPPLSGAAPADTSAAVRKERLWVAVRVRPMLEHEHLAHDRVAWRVADSATLQCLVDMPAAGVACKGAQALAQEQSGTAGALSSKPSLQYDAVFSDQSSSAEVYTATARGLVASAVRGYNTAIIAYGQARSGKTFTMQACTQAMDAGCVAATR
jgi:hypothetical protein